MALTCGDTGSTGQQVITQINTNTTDIATNVTDIATNATKIVALDNLQDYVANSTTDVLNIPDTYTSIGKISAVLSSGKYVFNMSATYSFDTTNKSVFNQFTINGNSEEFMREPRDTTDRIPQSYSFPFTWPGGQYDAEIFLRKEDETGILDCYFGNVWVEKKDEL